MSGPDFIVGYISDSTTPLSIFEFAAELAENGNHGAAVPKATAQHWKREIEQAIAKGLLVEDANGNVKAPAMNSGQPTQMTLF